MSILDEFIKNIDEHANNLEDYQIAIGLLEELRNEGTFVSEFPNEYIHHRPALFIVNTTIFCVYRGNGIEHGVNIFTVLAIKYKIVKSVVYSFENRQSEVISTKSVLIALENKGKRTTKAERYPILMSDEINVGSIGKCVKELMETL